MSTNLFARPTPKKGNTEYPSFYASKWILAPRYLGHDGSLSSDKIILTLKDLPFLEGVLAAATKEVKEEIKEIITMLEQHESIQIWTE